MIDSNLMNLKIKTREAEVIKVNERMSNGIYIKMVKFNDEIYRLCPICKFYKKLDNFTWNKSSKNYHSFCKEDRAKQLTAKYNNNEKDHIRQRMYAINRKVKNKKDKCTIDEFTEFFKTGKCPYTGKTLMDDFINPHPNPNLRLEIDHIKPVSQGGSSKVENLQVVPRVINTLKRDCNSTQFRETLDFLTNFAAILK